MCTVPDEGTIRPASIRRVVVLPAPFGPSSAKISPCREFEREIVNRHAAVESSSEMGRGQHALSTRRLP